MPGGRPTKLTPELIERVCHLLRQGNYRKVAARACSVGMRTFQKWLATGKEFPDGLYGQFRRGVIQAECDAEINLVGCVHNAGLTDPDYAIKYLGLKFPVRWGRLRMELANANERIRQLERQVGDLLGGPAENDGPSHGPDSKTATPEQP